MQRAMKSWSCPGCTFPAEIEQDCTLPSFISSQITDKYHFYGLFYATFFYIFVLFLLAVFLFKMTLKYSPELLLHVSKCGNAMGCHMEKIYVLNLFHSAMSYRATGYDLNANESIRYIKEGIFKHTHQARL